MGFSDQLKRLVEPKVRALIEHPFNRALLDESLSTKQYTYYCVQDDLYLEGYARALASVAVKLPQRDHMALFLRFALESVDYEYALHQRQIEKEPELASMYQRAGCNQACSQYQSFLLEYATSEDVVLGIAAILPCFYVYLRVGQAMRHSRFYHAKHGYREWIDVYAGSDFSVACDQAFAVLEQCVSLDANNAEIVDVFEVGVEHEQKFWSAALCPVGDVALR